MKNESFIDEESGARLSPQGVSQEVSEEVRGGFHGLTFEERVDLAADQLCLREDPPAVHHWRLAWSLVHVMAAVLGRDPRSKIRVGGEDVEAEEVHTVYRRLNRDHLNRVMDSMTNLRGQVVKYSRAYMMTALYNVYFESDLHSMVELNNSGLI